MEKEQYKPTEEEIKKAEGIITEEEKEMSKEREETLNTGYEKRESEIKTLICAELNRMFEVYLPNKPGNFGWGNNEYEALGNFISKNKKLFGIEIKSIKKPDTEKNIRPYHPPSINNPFA